MSNFIRPEQAIQQWQDQTKNLDPTVQQQRFAKYRITENIRLGLGRPSFRGVSPSIQEWAIQQWEKQTKSTTPNPQDTHPSEASTSVALEQPETSGSQDNQTQSHPEISQQSLFKKRKLWEGYQTQQQLPLKKRKIDIEQQTTDSEFATPELSQPPLQKLKIYKETQSGKTMFFSHFVSFDETNPQALSSGPSAST
ncbi:hypothetical protein Psal006b_02549 [Piscirickettsia salmonis]|uniref:Uncharacterized protein n=1 Tax=Piscirickettsia salmonis TaxID=1238 RepID=A0A1L6T9K0_PISSA|nr:hypothetical protein [Piscirickettsia salmonis]AKP73174.1 hypothetical protein PSLF89_1186 [Piscirickettsia salmonis LF-89 = ATCC VR-1361]ALB21848.1 hypothetical protein KU39_664 [Piscirickettsia salmonis]ALY02025.1 hypothetical protein AWE47_03355 [Piscirickettsia salmonis]AMA41536.1 hypothetical protein AWJ11_03350 [Piscirickettsia salmonis]AOS34021.1 hypothetical protein AVM72_00590 [Piscirickettsia salmonis]